MDVSQQTEPEEDAPEPPTKRKAREFAKDQEQLATNYGVKLSSLANQARNLVRDLEPSNDLTFLRV